MDIPDNNKSDDKLKDLLSNSRLEMPFTDFEDKVMANIKKEVQKEKEIDRSLRLSWLFFALGTTFGLLLSIILSPGTTILGIPVDKLAIPAYITGGTLLLLFVEKLLQLTIEQKKDHI